ncbi:long-chain-fatty-acid--CoA ligase [Rhodococcus sp. IEGM 1354]|uniref:long-chain-fatty-acid--CoA ligase n=1 Tax=Rhodococcus sp. IEGM 1354 TaxID=3047088 RepID=UPI0024B72BD9|nr:long-chain-fatty-acid--CoA ligase [Rhodococcus sp. IEGM 1354]MDI9933218.1 long-chain-fatty-acid--CoA ligase [Rhodococcus sp. IEGM 1354]
MTVEDQALVQGHPSTSGDDFPLNVNTLFRHAVRTYPEQHVVYRTADGGWDRYTMGECGIRASTAATVLAELGVTAGDVVGVLDWNSKRHFELYWAIPALGAVLLQMNLRLAPADLAYVTGHSNATIVLVDESLLEVAESIAPLNPHVRHWVVMTDRPSKDVKTTLPNVSYFEDLMRTSEPLTAWPMLSEQAAYCGSYTTGTTGRPKGVFYSHRSLYLHAMTMASLLEVSNADCTLLVAPMFHALSWGLPQAAIYAGSKIVLPGRYMASDTSVLIDAMVAEGVTVVNGAPAIYQPMLDHIVEMDAKPDFHRVRMLCGAAEPPVSLMRDLFEQTGAEVIHGYGATETTALISINRVKKSLQESLSDDEVWELKRCQGLPLPGMEIRVVDLDGHTLPHDGKAIGEILVKGPGVATSYYDYNGDDTHFTDGFWRTGDIGKILPNGYLKLTDRLKDVIKSGGEWISSIDMENALVAHPDVREAAVVGVPDTKWQERPVALVVLRPMSTTTEDDIRATLDGLFARWQMPDEIHFVDAIARTSVGKIDKRAIRAELAELAELAESSTGVPRDQSTVGAN